MKAYPSNIYINGVMLTDVVTTTIDDIQGNNNRSPTSPSINDGSNNKSYYSSNIMEYPTANDGSVKEGGQITFYLNENNVCVPDITGGSAFLDVKCSRKK